MSVHCCRPYECHGAKVRSQQQISTVCACVAELETQVHWKVGLYQHFSDAGSHTVDSQMTGRERDAATAVKTQETIILFWLLLFLYQESWCCRFSVRRRLQRDWHTSSISINVYRALNISRFLCQTTIKRGFRRPCWCAAFSSSLLTWSNFTLKKLLLNLGMVAREPQ